MMHDEACKKYTLDTIYTIHDCEFEQACRLLFLLLLFSLRASLLLDVQSTLRCLRRELHSLPMLLPFQRRTDRRSPFH